MGSSDLKPDVCVILQRVKNVKLGESLEPVADDILRLIAERMTSQETRERMGALLGYSLGHNAYQYVITAALQASGVVEDVK